GVAFALDWVVIEGPDFRLTHAARGKPARDVDVTEPLDVDQDLAGSGACGGAGSRERVADHHQTALPVSMAHVKIDRTNPDETRHREIADHPPERRPHLQK